MSIEHRPISPLCQRMIEDMRLRKLAEKTQSGYLRWVKHFTRFHTLVEVLVPDEDLRREVWGRKIADSLTVAGDYHPLWLVLIAKEVGGAQSADYDRMGARAPYPWGDSHDHEMLSAIDWLPKPPTREVAEELGFAEPWPMVA